MGQTEYYAFDVISLLSDVYTERCTSTHYDKSTSVFVSQRL